MASLGRREGITNSTNPASNLSASKVQNRVQERPLDVLEKTVVDSPKAGENVAEFSLQAVENFEIEEGEIRSPRNNKSTQEKEEGWQISKSAGKYSNKKSNELVYGQVKIASPTRFDVLRDCEDEVEFEIMSNDKPVEVIEAGDLLVLQDQCPTTHKAKEKVVVRPVLQRSSKKTHKLITYASKSARASNPSTSTQRNSKNKN